ncbi:MAG TPA: ClpXP protease specificity-enhancing factor SspB [Geminicoccaceae bacterium]|nr:ClpXP protease specificity-enhancing factor SspB [Geminicoccaceae bacterium]
MPPQSIDYGRLVERALRSVVRDALEQVARHGLPGRHHLYITFQTDHPAVVIDDSLRARYPAEMTIVLQHQFWDLEIGADGFAIGLSFSDLPHRLEIPFEAVTVFADPSVEFGLQLGALAGTAAATTEAGAKPAAPAPVSQLPTADGPRASPTKDGSAEVVALDRFRKK